MKKFKKCICLICIVLFAFYSKAECVLFAEELADENLTYEEEVSTYTDADLVEDEMIFDVGEIENQLICEEKSLESGQICDDNYNSISPLDDNVIDIYVDENVAFSGKSANIDASELNKLEKAFSENNNKLSKIMTDKSLSVIEKSGTTIKYSYTLATDSPGIGTSYFLDVDSQNGGDANTYLYYIYDYNGSYVILRASVDITTLNENSVLSFALVRNDISWISTSTLNNLIKIARDYINVPLMGWRLHLAQYHNIDITKLGFSNMESILNIGYYYSQVQAGEQNAGDGSLTKPLSAWKLTSAVLKRYKSNVPIGYKIRLEEMYVGDQANKIVNNENLYNNKPTSSQQWILMKFYLENTGNKELSASQILSSENFYTNSGASVAVKDTATLSGDRKGMGIYDLKLQSGASGYFWFGILIDKNVGFPYIRIDNGYDDEARERIYSWLNTNPEYVYQSSLSTGQHTITTSGIYCSSTYPSIVAGMVTTKNNASDVVEYRWQAYDESTGVWSIISPWTKNNEWLNWTPSKSGNYVIVGQARVVGNEDSPMIEASFGVPYHKHIKGICQMPYTGEGGGFLIGVESYDNPNQSYTYEMLILDCTLLAEGKDAWIYTTGRCGVAEGNALWTVWQPQYGYYWTLFRIYDANGNMIDEACFGFVNAY